jgi:lysophospholipase L1-like esterase/endonuclease YncB( thermonuclease family)
MRFTFCFAISLALLSMAYAVAPAARADDARHYAAIGDSVTGTGSAAPNGWVKGYAATAGVTQITNLAQNGWTSSQILHALRYDPWHRRSVRDAQLVTINAGMNEFFTARDAYSRGACGGPDNEDCIREMLPRFAANWHGIVAEVRALAPGAAVVALTLYHPLEVFDQHFGWADAMNRMIRAMNATVYASRLPVADILTAYNGPSGLEDPIARGFILPDAIHGTDLGHAVVVGVLRSLNVTVPTRLEAQGVVVDARPTRCTVAGVIDGETVQCAGGTNVRLMHVDAPSSAACGAEWARMALAMFLPAGREIGLEYGAHPAAAETVAAPMVIGRDGHEYNVSILMLYVGLARASADGDAKFRELARASEVWARGAYWNMWAAGAPFTRGC